MDTRTGHIRELAPGEKPRRHEIPLSQRQASELSNIEPAKRVEALERQLRAAESTHPAARPEGLTDDDWRAQRNALKRLRRARRGRR